MTDPLSFSSPEMPKDWLYMRRALRLAALGRHASPNPMVGCVIVSAEGYVIGEGFHPKPGMPHAEIYALAEAGDAARGGTAYVTLEPCAHFGRTPPCADALLRSGVSRVVAAMRDPNLEATGGLERLRDGGVALTVGVEEARAQALNAAFIKLRTLGLPWVVLKTAASLDGKTATSTGDSQWISSAISRRAVHRQLRDRCDAILTGIGTVLADNPALTTRLRARPGRNAQRIIVDSRCRLPTDSRLVREGREDGKTTVVTTEAAAEADIARLRDSGCHVWVCTSDTQGRVDLRGLMRRLGTQGDILTVLVEGGALLVGSLIEAQLVDRWIHYLAPKIIGGTQSPGLVGDPGVTRMADAHLLKDWRVRRSGDDLVIDAQIG
jgi:diaminohydroxyphosphoribosylaminopyrimidine deaminase/5-amino-6-(5-phosphoribosylamino)uracil reductase